MRIFSKNKKGTQAETDNTPEEKTRETSIVNDPNGDQSKPKETKSKKSKSRKNHKKLCHYCLSVFESVRSDAKYCSNKCKQAAYEKQDEIMHFPNPAEYFLIKTLRTITVEIIDSKYEGVTLIEVEKWQDRIAVSNYLYSRFIERNNFYSDILYSQIAPFINKLHVKCRESAEGSASVIIPRELEVTMESFNTHSSEF
jgi:hypothetical protein